ncbi:hypothetical protein CK203_050046 [Vitis vinifera]|uniref:Uncharacterized protein n=1 Tax=Vitis vinifera TaxID=29760 RepID=A0A438H4Y0_VITVI|nr:hypothetical protein CK203_050046 [Vitis vinifera]
MFWLQLKHFRKLYESYVPMKYRSYLKQMKKLDLCGDAYLFYQENGEIILLYKLLLTE